MFSVRDGAFPHRQLWQAACVSKSPGKYFSLPQSKWASLRGRLRLRRGVAGRPALFANAVLLGMPLTERHHFCTSKLSSARDAILGYLGDTEYTACCFLLLARN